MKKKKLEWGETIFDDLSKEELLRQCQKMFAALQAAHTVIDQTRRNTFWPLLTVNTDDHEKIKNNLDALAAADGYWGKGTGARGYEMTLQALEIAKEAEGEDQYRAFFRYAVDLLFRERDGIEIGFGWAVCSKCGVMIGRSGNGESMVGKNCTWGDSCKGVMRKLKWSDLEKGKPQKKT